LLFTGISKKSGEQVFLSLPRSAWERSPTAPAVIVDAERPGNVPTQSVGTIRLRQGSLLCRGDCYSYTPARWIWIFASPLPSSAPLRPAGPGVRYSTLYVIC